MSGRFQGKWPVDRAGNPMTVTIAEYPYQGLSHKLALTSHNCKAEGCLDSKAQKTLIKPSSKISNRAVA